MTFTQEEVDRCKAAMEKAAPREALAFINSGRVVVELGADFDVYLDRIDGMQIRDHGYKMPIAGAWPLYRAGMIDDACQITEAGHELLRAIGHATVCGEQE